MDTHDAPRPKPDQVGEHTTSKAISMLTSTIPSAIVFILTSVFAPIVRFTKWVPNIFSSTPVLPVTHAAPTTSAASAVSATSSSQADGRPQLHYWNDWRKMLAEHVVTSEVVEQIEKLEAEMLPLEALERNLWAEYGLSGQLDHDALLTHCQHLTALSEAEPQSTAYAQNLDNLMRLDQLHQLRRKKCEATRPFRFIPGSVPRNHTDEGDRIHTDWASLGQRFWAILVGIDDYDKAPALQGCGEDVRLIHEYLTTDLAVPEDHICVLCSSGSVTGARPTRANILGSIRRHLRDNPAVRPGDNMLFHFSGRGSQYAPGAFFRTKAGKAGSIEALCPADRGDYGDHVVPDISDREFNVILSDLRDVKGANITVTLDCSFPPRVRSRYTVGGSRYVDPLADGLKGCLLAAEHHERITTERWKPDMTSHVVVAACEDNEAAFERLSDGRVCGAFTAALLAALRTRSGQSASYVHLVEKVIGRLRAQTPVCAGKNKNSRVWYQPAPKSDEDAVG